MSLTFFFQDETAPGVAIPESGEGKVRGWQKEPLSIMWCLNSFVAESSSQSRLIYASTSQIKFIYSEKATKFCEIFPLLLTVCTVVKSKGKISQNFVAFSEYMNFMTSSLHSASISQILVWNKFQISGAQCSA